MGHFLAHSLTLARSLTAILMILTVACVDMFYRVPASQAAAAGEAWCLNDDEGNAHCNYATCQQLRDLPAMPASGVGRQSRLLQPEFFRGGRTGSAT